MKIMALSYLFVAAGGALGAMARFAETQPKMGGVAESQRPFDRVGQGAGEIQAEQCPGGVGLTLTAARSKPMKMNRPAGRLIDHDLAQYLHLDIGRSGIVDRPA
jgi:hypothetical protein